tara:strand:+ start:1015 stop:3780 length:2766 start_codon:yes stop_codon:yes gene_type:complete
MANQNQEKSVFINQLTNDIESLEKLILNKNLECFDRIGAEQEFCLIDDNFRPNAINDKIVEKIKKHGFVTEIAKFNMELNIDPINLSKNALREMENVLISKMDIAKKIAKKNDSDIIMTGILPTVRKHDLRLNNISNNQRYFDLCDAISKSRGNKYKIRISGLDELIFQHDSPLIEGCNTGFQFHLQIDPKAFARIYNFAQLIAAPVLATSVNSPILFGKRLWQETRIAVFQQATDTRIIGNYHLESLPRVTFGNKWLDKSLIEIFKEDITRYKILLKSLNQKINIKQNLKIPRLDALSLHNSTVYRWNRPCYGIYKGKPSVRIENRMLPSGPSIVDEVANSSFWLGLLFFYKNSDIEKLNDAITFDDARINFYAAAQQGLDATFRWLDGKRIDARKLILNELIPKAAIGLSSININPKDIEKYLNIIKERTKNRQNGSRWIINAYDSLIKKFSKQNALTTITSEIIQNQEHNIPVHKWNKPNTSVVINNPSKLLVEECMDRDINSINEEDIFELAYQINLWTKKDYMVVVNQKGHITGVLTRKILNNNSYIKRRRILIIKSVMQKNPKTISPNHTIEKTLGYMKKYNVNILPVVENKLFIGMIHRNNLIHYEKNTDEKLIKKETSENYERVIGNYHSNNKKTLIFITGIHGNENSGLKALENFFNIIQTSSIKIEGSVIGLIGNLAAVKKKSRYLDEDMNRVWKEKQSKSKTKSSEQNEMHILKKEIEKIIINKNKKNICIIDLHNTSSPNGVFAIANNQQEVNLAAKIGIPVITNLFTKVQGSLSSYYSKKDIMSIVFEGGAIGDPASIKNHEAGIWKILLEQKMIKLNSVPKKISNNLKIMQDFSIKKGGLFQVKYIHEINKKDDFFMIPNMKNFDKIKKHDIIGHDRKGEVKAPISGYLLMPLYQEKGKEGFYIVGE